MPRFLTAVRNLFTGKNSESAAFIIGVVGTVLQHFKVVDIHQWNIWQDIFFGYTGLRVYTKSVGPPPGSNT